MAGQRIRNSTQQTTNPEVDQEQMTQWLLTSLKVSIDDRVNAMLPDIQRQIEEKVSKAQEQVVSDFKNSEQDLKKVKNEIEISREELKSVKNSVLGVIAVFAAFFTFISVNVNVFSKADPIESMALMIVMWVCLMGFLYTFFVFLWEKWSDYRFWIPVILGMLLACTILGWVKHDKNPILPTSRQERPADKSDNIIPAP